MKKYLALLLCLVVMVPLAACTPIPWPAEDDTTTDTTNDIRNEAAMAAYEAVLSCDAQMWSNGTVGEALPLYYLKDFKFSGVRLDEAGPLQQAFVDINGDGLNECIVTGFSNDSLLLYYHDGHVYFTNLNVYYEDFHTDGSCAWNDTSAGGHEYGESQLFFDGNTWESTELWRVVNDGETDAAYYVGGEQVSKEVLSAYTRNRVTTAVEFSPFAPTWQKAVSRQEAEEIASEHWGIKTGDVDTGNGFRYRIVILTDDNGNYNGVLQWLVEGLQYSHYSMVDEIVINSTTGEVSPYNYNGGK